MNSLNIKVKEEAEFKKDFTLTQYEPKLKKECKPQDFFIELTTRYKSDEDAVSLQDNASDLSN